jgi:hypothetical protein
MPDYSDQAELYTRRVALRNAMDTYGPGLHDDVMLNHRDAYYAEGGLAPWERDDTARFGPSEPPVGTVLRYGGPDAPGYAVHVPSGHWAVAGLDDEFDWPAIARRIGDQPCEVAVAWREIPRPEPTPAGDDAVKDWASQFLPVTEHEVTDVGTEEQS